MYMQLDFAVGIGRFWNLGVAIFASRSLQNVSRCCQFWTHSEFSCHVALGIGSWTLSMSGKDSGDVPR